MKKRHACMLQSEAASESRSFAEDDRARLWSNADKNIRL